MANTYHNRCTRGFTLIEMLVMIIIIAVLSSVAVPKYYDFAMKSRFQESVHRVLAMFSDARDKAIQSGADCVVRFDPQSATFVVETELSPPEADQPAALQDSPDSLPALPSEPLQLGENITVSDFQMMDPTQQQQRPMDRSRTMEIHFHDDGRADGAAIMLAGAEGERAAIEIASLTGRASLREDEP